VARFATILRGEILQTPPHLGLPYWHVGVNINPVRFPWCGPTPSQIRDLTLRSRERRSPNCPLGGL